MRIPYRTQQTIKRTVVVLLVLAAIGLLLWFCWLLWLSRFAVYTDSGVVLDFENTASNPHLEQALPPQQEETFPIYYNEGDAAVSATTELSKLTGYYIAPEAVNDLDTVKKQLRQLSPGTPVMVEVKNSFGSFYYNTKVGESIVESVDPAKMDQLIEYINSQNFYTIARLPALRDYYYGLNYTHNGLPTAGGYLWADDDYRYWLNPGKEGTLAYLSSIIGELHDLGFDEVLLTDFRFPDTDQIVFSGDKAQTVADAAQYLVTTCSASNFAVSFEGSDGFQLPEGRSRIYRIGVVAAQAEGIAAAAGLADPAVQLAFVTDLYDTRFDAYGTIRPITSAIAQEDN